LEKQNLREILCFEHRRSASRGCAVSFERRLFQILKDSRDKKRSVKEIKPRERKETA
jgi:hypothetical protein